MEIHAFYYLDQKLLLDDKRTYILGRAADSDICLPEKTVSRQHARLRNDGGEWVLTDLASTNGTLVNHQRIDERALKDGDHVTLGPFICVYRHFLQATPDMEEFDSLLSDTLQVERRIKELIDQAAGMPEKEKIHGFKHFLNGMRQRMNSVANADRLTGLFNRRFFDHQLAFELERAGRYGHSVSLLLLDIDHFKQVNDRHGHQKGDDVLATVGALVESHTRSSDIAARYGGEEMAVILPETNREQAAIAAEKLRRRIENDIEGRAGLAVTVSIGVATAVPSETKRGPAAGTQTPAGLIEAADQALYRAKELGRNQVVMR